MNIIRLSSMLIVSGLLQNAVAQQPELIVEIDRRQVYQGESLLYSVTLNHVENPSPPELRGFDDFQVTPAGEESRNVMTYSNINGVQTQTVRRGRQYNYRLTPTKSGELNIPPPTARVDNRVLAGRSLMIRVVAPTEQDTAFIQIHTDRTSVYPMQPFTVTLTVFVRELPDPYSERNPLGIQQSPPGISIPWYSDDQLADGLEPEKNWQELLEPLLDRRGVGLQINNIGQTSVFSLIQRTATAFQPTPQRTQRSDKDGKPVGYWKFSFPRTFVSRKVREYEFGPVTLKGMFGTAVTNGRLKGDQIYAMVEGITVAVKNVPAEGRPETFIGAVGRFEFDSVISPTTARVGDPMTLSLTLSGQGTLEQAFAPDLKAIPEIARNFKTYDATEETKGNSRRFTYSLRPLNTEIDAFPAVPISYFDVEQERYITVTSPPMSLEIHKAERLSNDEIVAQPNPSSPTATSLQASEDGIFANDSNLSSLKNEAVHPPNWALGWGFMFGGYVMATLVIGRVQRLKADPALVRRRGAAARARSALKAAAGHADNAPQSESVELLRNVITGLVADVSNAPEAGITPRDAHLRLSELDVPRELTGRVSEFLNQCDAARYGSLDDSLPHLRDDAQKLLDDLLLSLKSKKLLS